VTDIPPALSRVNSKFKKTEGLVSNSIQTINFGQNAFPSGALLVDSGFCEQEIIFDKKITGHFRLGSIGGSPTKLSRGTKEVDPRNGVSMMQAANINCSDQQSFA
jgi:hypothetical protein